MFDTLTVTQYNTYIKQIFDAEELLHNIKIVGEVFGLSISKTAIYFSLKDEGGSVGCVCFYPSIMADIKDGDKVIVTGSPNYYVKGGRLSFVVQKLEKQGQGDLYAQFLMMKDKLEKEGLFDQATKKSMPQIIKTIGVITSKEGAVIHDICNVARRRDPSINIALFPVKVQGNGAEIEIANAINQLSDFDQIDAIVVARGGGSMEDLAAYNTEIVARATFACNKFIVSAVGHETDFTIIDFVSDLRAPTPSAAAELLTRDKMGQKNTFDRLLSAFTGQVNRFIENKILTFEKQQKDFENITDNYIANKNFELGMLENSLNKLNPFDILKRGYAKVEQAGKVVDKAEKVVLQSDITVNFYDGKIVATPKEVKK